MSQDRNPSPKGDDRNLVVVDEDFAQADAEDRLWLFWERHRSSIVGTIAAVLVGLLSWFAYRAWDDARQEAVRSAYAALADDAARRAFAKEHAGDPLAVAALLTLADDLHAKGKGTSAAYAEAAAADPGSSRAGQALLWRARLYAGLLALDEGASADGAARLAEVAEADGAPDALRGPAFLALARAALAAKDTARAREWLDKMDRLLGANHPWREEQRRLIATEPALRPGGGPGS